MLGKLGGAIAAAVTPLRDRGASLDEASVAPLIRFLADGGMDGVLTCGTTGEGVLLSVRERTRMTELCLEARPPGFAVRASRRWWPGGGDAGISIWSGPAGNSTLHHWRWANSPGHRERVIRGPALGI